MGDLIRFKRGSFVDLPNLMDGEPAFALDEKRMFVGVNGSKTEIVTDHVMNTYGINALYPPIPLNACKGDGVTDDSNTLQNLIDFVFENGGGVLYLPFGKKYGIGQTLILKPQVQLQGGGTGSYFSGGGGDTRTTAIIPLVGFVGTEVVRIDPADINNTLSNSYGVCVKDIIFDFINVFNDGIKGLLIKSLTNAPTFQNLVFVNNDKGENIEIDISTTLTAFVSDGLSFYNIITLPRNNNVSTLRPTLRLKACNEIVFRDCKFQHSVTPLVLADSQAVLIEADTSAVSGVTFDNCSFTGAETGVLVNSKAQNGSGARWVRLNNCTFEGVNVGARFRGVVTRPTQFCFMQANRFVAPITSGTEIIVEEFANNNQFICDEFTDVLLEANSEANLIIGAGTITDNGIKNAYIQRKEGKISLPNYQEGWQTVSLGSSWVSNTVSRTAFGFRKDFNQNKVALRGYLTGGTYGFPNYIFTLPTGYRPTKTHEIAVACGSATGSCKITILDDGRVFATGGANELVLDGVSFYLD